MANSDKLVSEGMSDTRHTLLRCLRHRLMPVYRRLFSLVFLANLACLVYMSMRDTSPTAANAALLSTPIAANIFVAVLFRTDDFINLLYVSVVWVPHSLPLSVRQRLAKIYELGGVHSGTGVAATFWTCLFAAQTTRSFLADARVTVAVLAITWIILAMLLTIIIMAHPAIRSAYHNAFERTHRFCGWGSIILYWALNILLTSSLASNTSPSTVARSLFTSPTIYFLIATTLLLILPWTRLRRVDVRPAQTSSHATRFYFDSLLAQPTQTIRISTSPLLEWHSFACIPSAAPYSLDELRDPSAAMPSAEYLTVPSTTASRTSSTRNLLAPTPSSIQHASATVFPFSSSSASLNTLSNPITTISTPPASATSKPTPYAPFSILVSAAGDWTRTLISRSTSLSHPSQTQKIWFRGRPTTGVTKAALLFKSAVIVTTGSGIGPALSLLMLLKHRSCANSARYDGELEKGEAPGEKETDNGRYRLIWSTPSPLQTYGQKLLDEIMAVDEEAVVWDTQVCGRPDLEGLAWGVYKGVGTSRGGGLEEREEEDGEKNGSGSGSEYEAVFVVSNQKVTEKVVYALERRGVPAFGPVFDS